MSALFKAAVSLNRGTFCLSVDLELPATGISVLFGHSGSGKTTLLRCIAGLERGAQGIVCFNGEFWQTETLFVPTHKRPIGYVFQDAQLFPHLSVRSNIRYGMSRSKVAWSATTDDLIALLGISHLVDRMPASLSGGERQRVAIARALALNPKLLLMDEPLASLDDDRKKEILPYIESLHRTVRIPILYVTHSTTELARLADYIVVLNQGTVAASGPATELLSRTDSPLAKEEEAGAIMDGMIAERDTHWHLCRVAAGTASVWMRDSGMAIGNPVRLRILARDVSIATEAAQHTSIQNAIPGVITSLADDPTHPALLLARIDIGEHYILARLAKRAAHTLGIKDGSSVIAQIKTASLLN